jgi:hypothetical protein
VSGLPTWPCDWRWGCSGLQRRVSQMRSIFGTSSRRLPIATEVEGQGRGRLTKGRAIVP